MSISSPRSWSRVYTTLQRISVSRFTCLRAAVDQRLEPPLGPRGGLYNRASGTAYPRVRYAMSGCQAGTAIKPSRTVMTMREPGAKTNKIPRVRAHEQFDQYAS